ncbi:hypothetical protein EG829_29645, partial [bacterium]|nr:hypothetical protein [bacterium]
MLPLHLGWWGFQSFDPPQIEPTYPDVMEAVAAKLVGWDAGLSLTAGVDRKSLAGTPLFRRGINALRICAEFKRTNAFDSPAKARLRDPGQDFELTTLPDGRIRFRPVMSDCRTVVTTEPWTQAWRVTNAFGSQPIRIQIEALTSANLQHQTNPPPVADLAGFPLSSWEASSAKGVNLLRTAPVSERSGLALTATNGSDLPRNSSWVRLSRKFDPPVNWKDHQGLYVDVEGDDSGALFAIRLESPHAVAYGAVADRYLPLDFKGRRRVLLVESESSRWSDYSWNDGKSLYNVYRETVRFDVIESASIYLQNLAPGVESRCRIFSAQPVKLESTRLKNPRISLSGATLELPVELASGDWLEANA